MIKKVISAVCIAFIIAVQTVFCIASADSADIIEELFSLNISERGASDFYDELVLGEADWTAFCRARLYGAENSAEFIGSAKRSAEELIRAEGFVTPTEIQRAAVLLSAYGECPRELINAAAYENSNLDKQGINAWIWALIAANCSGLEAENSALHNRTELAESLITKQLPDGGFALRGDAADVDVTAAAIYALAPLGENTDVKASLDRAVSALSGLQQEDGGFLSLGNAASESTAQAIIAFTAAGVDDERLEHALAALSGFRCEGGFSHTVGGKVNKMANSQALQAFAATELAERGERLFDKPAVRNDTPTEPTSEAVSSESTPDENGSVPAESGEFTGFHIKLIISAVLGIIGISVLMIGIARRGKNGIVIGAAALVLAGGVWLLDIRTPGEYSAKLPENAITVRVGAECTSVLSHLDSIDKGINDDSIIPADGVMIPLTEIAVPDGATAFDALDAAARERNIPVDRVNSTYGVYVRGIGNVYEFGFGGESGWTYLVNGESPQISSGVYKLSAGDTVEFIYICEYR